jgi:hypothetical protein
MGSKKKSPRSKRRTAVGTKRTLRQHAFMAADLLGEDAEQWYRDILSARRWRKRLRAGMTASKGSGVRRRRRPKQC